MGLAVALVATCGAGVFQINQARRDVQRARVMAKLLTDAEAEYERGKTVVDAVAGIGGLSGISDAAEAVVDLIEGGEVSKFKNAAADARLCQAELSREPGFIGLLTFSMPTQCRSMFLLLGEAPELTATGQTLGNAAQKLITTGPPGSPNGPACEQWELTRLRFEAPVTKSNGKPWDVDSSAPDLFVMISVGNDRDRKISNIANSRQLDEEIQPPIQTMPGRMIELEAYDEDLFEHDQVQRARTKIPPRLKGTTMQVGPFRLAARCVRP